MKILEKEFFDLLDSNELRRCIYKMQDNYMTWKNFIPSNLRLVYETKFVEISEQVNEKVRSEFVAETAGKARNNDKIKNGIRELIGLQTKMFSELGDEVFKLKFQDNFNFEESIDFVRRKKWGYEFLEPHLNRLKRFIVDYYLNDVLRHAALEEIELAFSKKSRTELKNLLEIKVYIKERVFELINSTKCDKSFYDQVLGICKFENTNKINEFRDYYNFFNLSLDDFTLNYRIYPPPNLFLGHEEFKEELSNILFDKLEILTSFEFQRKWYGRFYRYSYAPFLSIFILFLAGPAAWTFAAIGGAFATAFGGAKIFEKIGIGSFKESKFYEDVVLNLNGYLVSLEPEVFNLKTLDTLSRDVCYNGNELWDLYMIEQQIVQISQAKINKNNSYD